MSSWRMAAVLAGALAASQCGGDSGGNNAGGGGGGNPAGPGTSPPTVTVSIARTQGNQSYVPNPVPVSSGERVVFQNNDAVAHRIVMNDNSVDFGNLAPGASSAPMAVGSGDFHCTIHPSMVGSINGVVAPEPPPGSGDGY